MLIISAEEFSLWKEKQILKGGDNQSLNLLIDLLGGLSKPVATSMTAPGAATDTATRALQKGFEPFAKEGFGAKLMVPEDRVATTLFDKGFGKEGFQSAGQKLMPALQQGFQTAAANPLASLKLRRYPAS